MIILICYPAAVPHESYMGVILHNVYLIRGVVSGFLVRWECCQFSVV